MVMPLLSCVVIHTCQCVGHDTVPLGGVKLRST